MTASSVEDLSLAPDPQTSRRLFQLGLGALLAGIAWLVYRSNLQDPLLLGMGVLVMILGAIPALVWARQAYVHFPVFEMFMLTSIPFYAVPLLAGHSAVLQFSPGATWNAAISIVLFQLAAVGAFAKTRGRAIRAASMTVSLLPASALRYAQAGIWLNTAYLYIYSFTDLIPPAFGTIVRAIFFGIGTVSLFIETRRWGAAAMTLPEKAVVVLNVLAQVMFLFRELYLIVGMSVLLLALIGYVSTSRRIPLVLVGIVLPIIAVLHNGKSVMRRAYWEDRRPLPELADTPAFFQTWFVAGLQPPAMEDSAASNSLAGRLFERASLFQMLCLVAENTPEPAPYLEGESYKYVPIQLIPTPLWPDKPSSLLSNVLLAVHYHLVSADATTTVSIAFGMIAEAYANFGIMGCVSLGLLLGHAYKRLSVAAVGRSQFSAVGLLTILLAAWSFQVEQIFATWFVSLLQAAAVVIGGPMVFRALFQQE